MKHIFKTILIALFSLSVAVGGITLVSAAAQGTITQLDQFTSTTTPATAITQRTIGKAFRLSGQTSGCAQFSSNGTLTSTGIVCGSGGGGGGSVTSVDMTVPTGLSISGNPITTAGTLALSLTAGFVIPKTASTTEWATAYASTTALTPAYMRGLFSNTATGLTYSNTTGVTSLTSGYIIPTTASTTNYDTFYATPSNRITPGTGLSWTGNTLNAANTFSTSSINGFATTTFIFSVGTAGSDFNIATTTSAVTFNCPTASASNRGCLSNTDWSTFNGKQASGSYITALTGDVTASGPGSTAATLATVNSNVGTFQGITVNGKGLVTGATNQSYITNATGAFVNDATNATLTRTGSGPYTLGINLANANTWSGGQIFGNATSTNHVITNASTTNSTTTNAVVVNEQVTNSTTTTGVFTNSSSTNATTTNFWVNNKLGIATATPATALDVKGGIVAEEVSTTFSATPTFDFSTANQFRMTMTSNVTAITLSNVQPGKGDALILCQDGTGSRTVAGWDSKVIWAGGTVPTQTSTLNKCDLYTFRTTYATGTLRVFGAAIQSF